MEYIRKKKHWNLTFINDFRGVSLSYGFSWPRLLVFKKFIYGRMVDGQNGTKTELFEFWEDNRLRLHYPWKLWSIIKSYLVNSSVYRFDFLHISVLSINNDQRNDYELILLQYTARIEHEPPSIEKLLNGPPHLFLIGALFDFLPSPFIAFGPFSWPLLD
jgi:hypothetical protein